MKPTLPQAVETAKEMIAELGPKDIRSAALQAMVDALTVKVFDSRERCVEFGVPEDLQYVWVDIDEPFSTEALFKSYAKSSTFQAKCRFRMPVMRAATQAELRELRRISESRV